MRFSIEKQERLIMLEIIEKKSFQVDSCSINKELIKKIQEIAGQSKTLCTLRSTTKDIKSDDIETFIGLEWPRKILKIHVEFSSPGGKAVIDLVNQEKKSYGSVQVTGTDAIWVKGVSTQLEDIFKRARTWYWPIVKYWQIRAVLSGIVLALLIWRLNHSLWLIASQYISISEMSFFVMIFVIGFALTAYPLELFWLWIFPRFEFGQNNRRKIRRYLRGILSLIITWIITNLLFPHLLPS